MTLAEFLASWQIDHINMGTQQTDAAKLSQDLIEAAAAEGISRDDLEVVAGKDLETHIRDAIREAIEEEMW